MIIQNFFQVKTRKKFWRIQKLAWKAALKKKTKVKLGILFDTDMILMVEKEEECYLHKTFRQALNNELVFKKMIKGLNITEMLG